MASSDVASNICQAVGGGLNGTAIQYWNRRGSADDGAGANSFKLVQSPKSFGRNFNGASPSPARGSPASPSPQRNRRGSADDDPIVANSLKLAQSPASFGRNFNRKGSVQYDEKGATTQYDRRGGAPVINIGTGRV